MAQDESMQDITESTAVTLPTTQASSPPDKKKRKRTGKNRVLSQFTMRSPPWSYIHLQHLTPPGSEAKLDAVTAHLHLTASLSQFLGVHGTAVSVDITKLEGKDVWIRVPNQDSSGWTSSKGEGWRVKGSSSWDARAMARDSGQDLFQF
ncbi:hypothetical protein D0865_15097 [Hortaea werneckii]|uniref:Ribonucleases P/MRP subunit Pop8-like domain-containing protein n=1 Tax=Hortaea werneckii TaxID=91943 RepID=A0A3M7AUE6_HORWE|nr:hypothetical protein D0865_15097 [Hortaea werneckii]